jgi:hypothetical protein
MNLQRNILLMCFCLSCDLGIAQVDTVHVKTNHRIILSVTFGAAMPVGSFGSYEREKPNEYLPSNIIGGAKIGYNGKAEGKYLFSKNFGILFNISATSNKVEEVPFKVLYPPDPMPALGGGSSCTSFIYTSANWQANNFLAGLTAQFENGNKTFSAKLLAGYQHLKSPQIQIDELGRWWSDASVPHTGTYSKKIFQSSASTDNLAFGLGIDLRMDILKRLGIIASIDYLVSHPSFDSDIAYIYDDEPSSVHGEYLVPSNFNKNISFICLNFGVSYAIK